MTIIVITLYVIGFSAGCCISLFGFCLGGQDDKIGGLFLGSLLSAIWPIVAVYLIIVFGLKFIKMFWRTR